MKNNKAVTLITLVITIVILVIIGGTTLGLVLGDDSLLNRVISTSEETKKAKVKEEIEIMLSPYIAERENNGTTLIDWLDANNIEYSIDEDGNVVYEKDGYFIVIDPKNLALDEPETITKLVKIGVNPKVVEPGDKVTAKVELGKNIDIDNCKYAFLPKTNEEITEDKITENLVNKVASNEDIIKLDTVKIGLDNDKQTVEIDLPTENKVGTYNFCLLIAYKNSDKKRIRKTEVTIGVPVTSLTLNKNELTILSGTSEQLTATIEPEEPTIKTITWTSSNTKVATVNNQGVVTGVGVGTATITATADGGNDVKAECNATIEYGQIETGLQVYLDSKVDSSRQATTWVDQSGHGNNATISGATWQDNNGLYFDGTDDFVNLGLKDYPNVTVEVIFSVKNTSNTQTLIGNGEVGGYGIQVRRWKI